MTHALPISPIVLRATMTKEEKRLLREGFGAIADEFRQQRATSREILRQLRELVRLAGGDNAKIQTIREDHDAITGQVAEHERKIRAIYERVPALAR